MLVNQLSDSQLQRKPASDQSIKSTIRLLALLMAVLLSLPLFLAGCLSDDSEEPERLADYGTYGSAFAHRLASRYPGRSPGSESEKSAAEMVVTELTRLGYEPETERFSFFVEAEAASDSEADSSDEASEDNGVERIRKTSQNIIVKVPGTGFIDEQETVIRRQIIIGAHYDTAVGIEMISPPEEEPEQEEETTPDETEETDADEEGDNGGYLFEDLEQDWTVYDGIHDNASGIGVLMTLARQLKNNPLEYDVVLIAFGAGTAGMAGSRHYAANMDEASIAMTDVMYNIDSIYAGDKVYAHAGWHALGDETRKDYHLRRKLYELTDVFYENMLYTNNQFMLYTNQATFYTPLPVSILDPISITEEDDPEPEMEQDEIGDTDGLIGEETAAAAEPKFIYREWTVRESDYRPFDKLGIAVVHFDSGDYNIQQIDDFSESNHPAFSPTDGQISNTAYDSTTVLNSVFDQRLSLQRSASQNDEADTPQVDQLTRRVNNVAFLILEAAKKGRFIPLA